MRHYSKMLAVGFAASLMLALAVSSASARRFELSSQSYRIVWNPLVFAGVEITNARVSCPVTLEGSFHSSTLSKVAEQLVGYVSRAIVGTPCVGGSARANTETLPWHVRYASFTGTLPNITSIVLHLVGASFVIESEAISGVKCRYTTKAGEPGIGTANRNTTTGEISGLAAGGVIASETFLCPRGTFSGTGRVTVQGGTAAITVRLVQ